MATGYGMPQVNFYGMLSGLGDTLTANRDKRLEKEKLDAALAAAGPAHFGQPSLNDLGQAYGSDYNPPSAMQPAPHSPAGGARAAGGLQDYFGAVRSAESSGNDAARNPRSSATGRYQFTSGTWNDLARKYPDLALTPEGRTDPAQQERAVQAFTRDNARALAQAGIRPDPGSLYAAHFLGSGDAPKVLKAPDDAPMAALVSPAVIQANPHLANMTAGAFKQWAAQKGGGGRGAPSGAGGVTTAAHDPAAAPGAPQRQPGAVSAPPVPQQREFNDVTMEQWQAMMRHEATRPLALEIAKARQGKPSFGEPTWMPNVGLVQRKSDGQLDVLKAEEAAPKPSVFEQRAQAAERFGLGQEDPDFQPYVLTGKTARTDSAPLTTVDKKAILEAEDSVQAAENVVQSLNRALELNDKAFYGFGAGTRGYAGTVLPDVLAPGSPEAAQATEELDNLVKTQALDQLKAVFGSMPTEGERKILMEIQGSVNQSPEIRKRIYERGIAAAERRMEFNRMKADELRSGTYFRGQGGGGQNVQDGVNPQADFPPEAVDMLQSDPSPEAQREFDEMFGPGASQRALGGL